MASAAAANEAVGPAHAAARTVPPHALRGILALTDFEDAARRYLPRPIFGFVSGGSETNASLRGNRRAYEDLSLVPRVLVNTAERTTQTTIFGRTYDAPFGFSPMGGMSMVAYQSDVVFARAAAEANIPMIMSNSALTPLERVAEAGKTAWFQAYPSGEIGPITALIERVARAGFETLCVTVDSAVPGNRENNVRSGFDMPLRPGLRLAWDCALRPRWLGMMARTLFLHGMPHYENMLNRAPLFASKGNRDRGRRDKLSWSHLELMRRTWKGRLVLKGVLNKEDVRIARESGVDGLIVSSHGGRQLDSAVAPLRVLPGIVSQAGGMTVMIDSGIRRGTDVLKALALGAHFVFIGRPFLYAAAIGGADGMRHAIKLLKEEIDRDMALLGIATLADMKRDRLMNARSFDGY
jgi:L-lactate dehydrogenase (cytochrome)